MRIDVLTLFPEMFPPVLGVSIIGKALQNEIVDLRYHNIRDYTENKHKKVDDYPYGGGLGMVMQCQPIFSAVDSIKAQIAAKSRVILMSPQGRSFDQEKARALSNYENLIIICGHYEGVDERVSEGLVDEEISIGDFVLTGGEIAAMAIIDAVCRLLPGVLKEDASHSIESFGDGLLEYPQYTRPPIFNGMAVPEVLLSGHHENVDKWRREQSLKRTLQKKPELLRKAALSDKDKKYLEKLKNS